MQAVTSLGLPLLTPSLLTKIGIIYTQLQQVEKIFPIIYPNQSAQPNGTWDMNEKSSKKFGAKFPAITSGFSTVKFAHLDDAFFEVF